MGKSRSVSIVIYFLMKLNGWTYLQALNYIRQRRSIANPNSGFARQLVSVSPEAAKVFG
jgi:protein-tyrosine phosphatase